MVAPWYKHPWVWFLISLPLTSVVASMITIWIAFKNADTVVSDTLHKQGMFYQEKSSDSQ